MIVDMNLHILNSTAMKGSELGTSEAGLQNDHSPQESLLREFTPPLEECHNTEVHADSVNAEATPITPESPIMTPALAQFTAENRHAFYQIQDMQGQLG